jgi:hypothetical protein
MSSALEQLQDELQKHADNWPGGADQDFVNLYFMDLQLRTERPRMEEQLAAHKELTDEYNAIIRNPPEERTEELVGERNSLLEKKEKLAKVLHPSSEVTEKHTLAFLDYLGKVGDQLEKQKAVLKKSVSLNKSVVDDAAGWLNNLPYIRESVEKARVSSSVNADLKQEISGLKRDLEAGISIAPPTVNE